MRIHQIMRILVGSKHIDQNPGIFPGRENIPLQGCTTRCRNLRFDLCVGHINGISAYFSFFGSLIDTRTITFVGKILPSRIYFQFPAGRLHQESGHGPVAEMIEAHDIFNRIFISGFPYLILVIRGDLHHTQRETRSGFKHPA